VISVKKGKMILNDKQIRTWKEAIVGDVEILCRELLKQVEKNPVKT
jgi:hypothetical protein